MTGDRQDFSVIATSVVPNLNMFSADAVQYVAEFRYGDDLVPLENITDWAVEKFARHYRSKAGNRGQKITKGSIFHYVYAVLHDPAFREKYLLNLKREFPRIPLYRDFWQWEAWGQALMKLHVDYDSVSPFPLKRKDVSDQRPESIVAEPKAKLKADKARGRIELDSQTSLTTIPSEAWDYKLGNRSALEWILDQYKEKKPKDPTIREKFNDYRFADYKEKVIDLLSRVTTVSVETVRIVEEMRTAGG
jgi:predicted helicase